MGFDLIVSLKTELIYSFYWKAPGFEMGNNGNSFILKQNFTGTMGGLWARDVVTEWKRTAGSMRQMAKALG